MIADVIAGLLTVSIVGLVTWVTRIEARTQVLQAENAGLRDLIEARFDNLEKRLDRIASHLARD